MSSILNATTSSGLQIAPDNSGSLQLQTNNGTTALTIDTSQNVGIGGVGSYKLNVISDLGMGLYNSAGTSVGIFTPGSTFQIANYFSTGSNITFSTNPNGGGNAERMRIDSSGNVGIGTSSPTQKLTLGAAGVARFYRSDNTRYGDIYADNNGFNIISASNSDNLYITAAGTSSNIILSTVNTARMTVDSSGYAQGTVNGLSAGRMLAWQYYRLNSGYAGSNATGAQSLFGVGVTLVGSTVYEFEAIFTLYKTAGTTSHTVSIGFGGTATLNNIGYSWIEGAAGAINVFNTAGASDGNGWITSASATVLTTASTTAARAWICSIKGTVSVNAGGTFIPQYTLSAAPGGAYTTQIGSYIKIAPLGASGANTNIGSWA